MVGHHGVILHGELVIVLHENKQEHELEHVQIQVLQMVELVVVDQVQELKREIVE